MKSELRERLLFECRKTKTKVITTANQNRGKCHKNQLKPKANTCYRPDARKNTSDQTAIGFSFASDWPRGWREFSRPITERSEAKPMQSQISLEEIHSARIREIKCQASKLSTIILYFFWLCLKNLLILFLIPD